MKVNGDRLQSLRKLMGLKQHEVEQLAGIPPGRLTQFESGAQVMPIEYMNSLTAFYGVTARDLTQPESVKQLLGLAAQIAVLFDGQLKFNTGEAYSPEDAK